MTIIAVDAAGTFSNADSEGAFNAWEGSNGVEAGSVIATATQLLPAGCGIF